MSTYLRTPLSSEEFVKELVTKKVPEWSEQLRELANIATTQPHATFTAFGHEYVHNPSKISWQNFYEILARILQESGKNLGKIIARLLARMSNNHARSMQNSCKMLARSCKNYPRFLQDPWKILPRTIQNLARLLQDPCKILQELSKIKGLGSKFALVRLIKIYIIWSNAK